MQVWLTFGIWFLSASSLIRKRCPYKTAMSPKTENCTTISDSVRVDRVENRRRAMAEILGLMKLIFQ